MPGYVFAFHSEYVFLAPRSLQSEHRFFSGAQDYMCCVTYSPQEGPGGANTVIQTHTEKQSWTDVWA